MKRRHFDPCNDSYLGGCHFFYCARRNDTRYQDSALTTLAAVGDTVGGLKDISANANHILQGTGSAEPTVTASNFGGLISLSGDGGGSLNVSTFTQGALARPYTYYITCFRSAGSYFIDGGGSGKRNYINFTSDTAGNFASATAISHTGNSSVAVPNVYCVVWDSTSVLYQNNVQKGSGSAGTVQINGVTLFKNSTAAAFGTGGIIGVSCHPGAHDSAQRAYATKGFQGRYIQ